jgi:protein phosphatase PTC7
LIHQSKEQQKRFNFPYQIGIQGDPPHLALEFQHSIKHNDIVVVGSDGLFDNLEASAILGVIQPFLAFGDSLPDPTLVADMISKLAYDKSLDP